MPKTVWVGSGERGGGGGGAFAVSHNSLNTQSLKIGIYRNGVQKYLKACLGYMVNPTKRCNF